MNKQCLISLTNNNIVNNVCKAASRTVYLAPGSGLLVLTRVHTHYIQTYTHGSPTTAPRTTIRGERGERVVMVTTALPPRSHGRGVRVRGATLVARRGEMANWKEARDSRLSSYSAARKRPNLAIALCEVSMCMCVCVRLETTWKSRKAFLDNVSIENMIRKCFHFH